MGGGGGIVEVSCRQWVRKQRKIFFPKVSRKKRVTVNNEASRERSVL